MKTLIMMLVFSLLTCSCATMKPVLVERRMASDGTEYNVDTLNWAQAKEAGKFSTWIASMIALIFQIRSLSEE